MQTLQSKTAVITGGTRGLGLAVARAFLDAGANVVVSSRTDQAVQSALDALASQGFPAERMAGTACDVAVFEQVQALADFAITRFGGFEIWINNAGLSAPYGPTAHVPVETFRAVLNTNILGTYHGSQVALAHFLPRRQGKLINLLGAGDKKPVPYQNGYASTKSWMRVFTLALAKEYRSSGVDIFAYNPGLMFTEMVEKVDALAGYEKRVRMLETVLRMWGQPAQVPAQKMVWLASADSDGKTGTVYRELSSGRILRGALAELGRRLMKQNPSEPRLKINSIQPALPDIPLPGKK